MSKLRALMSLGVVFLLVAVSGGASAAKKKSPRARVRPHVVVATLDTGTNPFHPTWRREQTQHPSTFIPGYPTAAGSVDLTFGKDQAASVSASTEELAKFKEGGYPYWIPGTNLIGTWAHPKDEIPIFDVARPTDARASHYHGAMASSQIAGLGFGLAPDAYLVIADRTPDGASDSDPYAANADALRWAADQPWIDIIHTNIQNILPLANESVPYPKGFPAAVKYAISKGKFVVSAGGNWYAEPTETSPHAGPPGVLAAGANDNCGYADFSNPDPHIVMDGYQTEAAAPNNFDKGTFGGTSSASPRITGYVAQVLLELRRRYAYKGGVEDGALLTVAPEKAPGKGPLADGRLVAAELHEVVRKTANPNPHESKWDGAPITTCTPQPIDLPFAFYPKMGYGEVSEHTIGDALKVLNGEMDMPLRPYEDMFYEHSEELRRLFWP